MPPRGRALLAGGRPRPRAVPGLAWACSEPAAPLGDHRDRGPRSRGERGSHARRQERPGSPRDLLAPSEMSSGNRALLGLGESLAGWRPGESGSGEGNPGPCRGRRGPAIFQEAIECPLSS